MYPALTGFSMWRIAFTSVGVRSESIKNELVVVLPVLKYDTRPVVPPAFALSCVVYREIVLESTNLA